MNGNIRCVRCGGPTSTDQFGNFWCLAGKKSRTCGHWWRRDHGCKPQWTSATDGGVCPAGCGWDHRLFFQPTVTTPDGKEHRYHAPSESARIHTVVAVIRPHGRGKRLDDIALSQKVAV